MVKEKEEILLTTEDVSKRWLINPATVRKWRKDKVGPDYILLPNGTIRYRKSVIQKHESQNTVSMGG